MIFAHDLHLFQERNFRDSLRQALNAALAPVGGMSNGLSCSVPGRNTALPLDLLDLCAKPARQSLFHIGLGSSAIEIFDRLTLFRKLDESTGHSLCTMAFGHKLL